jgi:hypothetical protein
MTGTIPIASALNRIALIERFVNEWPLAERVASQNDAIQAQDLIQEALQTVVDINRLVGSFSKKMTPTTTAEEIKRAHEVGFLLEKTARILANLIDLLIQTQSRLHKSLANLTDLTAAQNELTSVKNKFIKSWMLPDKEKVKLAKKQISEGDFQIL